MAANRRLTPFAGTRTAFGSVTGSYTTLIGPIPGRGVIIMISNSYNAEVWISLDGGTTDFICLQPSQGMTIDLSTNDAEFSGTVSIKSQGSAPTSGVMSVGVIRVL